MAVRDIEHELELLNQLREAEASAGREDRLRKALRDKVNVIVAKAATLAGELRLVSFIPDLCTAFERMLTNPTKSDPKCWGKEAIAKALKVLEHPDSSIFLQGVQHVQFEPVWGGEEDTATTVRATCALALQQCTDLSRDDKLMAIMRLLTESSPSVRKDGARALESFAGVEAAFLLRIKARMGDTDSTVLGQVFESLLRVEGEGAVAFVIEFLRSPQAEIREEACLALGVSRLDAAVAALRDLSEQKHRLLETGLIFRALAISRNANAFQTLLDTVEGGRITDAREALTALAMYRDADDQQKRISKVVEQRSESEIQLAFKQFFVD